MVLVLCGYALLAACVIFFSARLGYYVDLLDKKTSLASAFIGGVMLAAVTSLPEMFTSITSVAQIGKPELVIGNLLGSDLFNVFVLGAVFLLSFKGLMRAKVTRSHLTTAVCVLIVYGILMVAMIADNSLFFGGVSLISLVIFGLYLWSVRKMSGDEDTADEEDVSPLTLRAVVVRFVIYAVLLVIASILITYASDYLGTELGWGATFAGAILLGIATSLPEMISCFVLARIGNFNAMIGNIVGSNIFNFAVLLLADLVYWNRQLYVFTPQAKLLIGLGMVSALAALVLVRTLCTTNDGRNRPAALVALLSAVPVVTYVMFVLLSA
ncbi:MAG: cation transporter [Butyricicoccus sp.]|nr:cation transporter [Butyricicoccus sp.]